MNTRTLLAGIIIGLISAPFAVSALTVDEIQAQIRELMAKVAALQEQLRSVQQTNSSSSVTVVDPTTPSVLPANHRMCALLNRNLSFGAYGEDVQSLQEYLREQGYFSGEATGYFGPVTRGALQRWQEYNKIANQGAGWGMFGPISRERIKLWCGGTVNTERFAASPASGSAPLTVTFSTWLSGFRVNSISYSIDFGDGTSERAADCYAPADACQSPGQNMHTYQSDGIYMAKLIKTTDPCVGQPACRAAIHQETVATAQIRVGAGSVACTKEYKPVCALKQVQCITMMPRSSMKARAARRQIIPPTIRNANPGTTAAIPAAARSQADLRRARSNTARRRVQERRTAPHILTIHRRIVRP